MTARRGVWLRALFSATALGLVLLWLRQDLGAAWSLIRHATWWAVAAGTTLYLAVVLLLSERLRRVLAAYHVRIPLKAATQLSMIGLFFNNFLPTSFGGDIMKAHCASRLSRRTTESYLGVLADRLVGLVTMAGLGVLAFCWVRGWQPTQGTLTVGALGVSGGAWMVWQMPRAVKALIRRWPWLDRLAAVLTSATFTTRGLAGILLLSLAIQFINIVAIGLLARSLALPIGLDRLCLVMPLIWSVSLLPSLNGLGLREGAFVYFLGQTAGREGAFALSMLWLAVMTVVSLLGAPAYLAAHLPTKGEAA